MKIALFVCPLFLGQTATAFLGVHATLSQQSLSTNNALSATVTSKDTPAVLPEFASAREYLAYMETVSDLPKGFATGSAEGTFVSVEAPALGKLNIRGTIIYLTGGGTDNWAAVFTQNRFPGSPILVGKDRVKKGGPLHAIVINNKVSNVCSGRDGVADSEMVCEAVAKALGLPGGAETVLPSSTGVIGWCLPAKELAEQVVPEAAKNLQSESALGAAQAICTTDRYPKVRSKTLSNGSRIVGIAKGAGMIEPNMATMLSYIMTDATVSKSKLQQLLEKVVNQSFNSISVDGDESTSDTCVLMSSNEYDDTDMDEFETALFDVCKGLATDLVRNGEGTAHVMKVQIDNFPGSELEARRLGRHVVNSPLFKCAVAGNDPNTGRLAGAVGSYMGKYQPHGDVSSMQLTLGGRVIMKDKQFVLEGQEVEDMLSGHMQDAEYQDDSDYPPHQKFVEIGIDFGSKKKLLGGKRSSATVYGSDLTAEYVSINADYRS